LINPAKTENIQTYRHSEIHTYIHRQHRQTHKQAEHTQTHTDRQAGKQRVRQTIPNATTYIYAKIGRDACNQTRSKAVTQRDI